MKINSNSTAVVTGNYLLRAEKQLANSSKRLSSGFKINNASDAPAGYAISSKMRAQIKALEKAGDNADTAVNLIKTADGALTEVHDIIQRMNELAVKSANGTNTSADRSAIQSEINQLSTEIERIASQTDFNDQAILDGYYQYRGYTNTQDVSVLSYSDETVAGTYGITNITVSSRAVLDADGVPVKNEDGTVKMELDPDSVSYDLTAGGAISEFKGMPKVEVKEGAGDVLVISNDFGLKVELQINTPDLNFSGGLTLELEKMGAMRIQVGDKEGQVIEMNVPEISLKKMGIDDLDVTTQESARASIERIQNALDYTSSVRSKLGAYQNRLEHVVNSLDVTTESLEGSYSTLVDTDMAGEMTEYTRLSVLQQAATSMLAQANEFPQQALQLLQ